MSFSKAVIVVAPGCPAELIQELLGAGVLPRQTNVKVLLPSGDTRQYDQLMTELSSTGSAKVLPSPSRYFFSLSHLYWLWENLWPSENNLLLVVKSPYQDSVTALIVLSVMALSGKDIVLLFANPETVIDLTGQSFSERWLSRELNIRVLIKELGRFFWFLRPMNILYFLMFGGLIARKTLSEYLAFLSKRSRLKRT
jgi:hypothetical protein